MKNLLNHWEEEFHLPHPGRLPLYLLHLPVLAPSHLVLGLGKLAAQRGLMGLKIRVPSQPASVLLDQH